MVSTAQVRSSEPPLARLHAIAGAVQDPELPPLTLADLGILRGVERRGDVVVVTLTPTYSGCPAVEYIEDEVHRALSVAGCATVEIVRSFSPAWSTDSMTAAGREKLRAMGVAPPRSAAAVETGVALPGHGPSPVPCPRCESTDTVELSRFGSTACKALHRCNACLEPFDRFKEI